MVKEPARITLKESRLEVFVRAGTRRVLLITTLNILAVALLMPESLLAGQDSALLTEMTVASTRTKDLHIAIISRNGTLKRGENRICVVFQRKGTAQPVDVLNVSVDFTLLMGRIPGKPINGHLTEVQTGRYCGQISLGNENHGPASYYAFVCYTIGAEKKRKQRLFVSVR